MPTKKYLTKFIAMGPENGENLGVTFSLGKLYNNGKHGTFCDGVKKITDTNCYNNWIDD